VGNVNLKKETIMRVLKIALVVSSVVGIAACQQQAKAVDLSVGEDLAFLDSLALGTAVPVAPQTFVSPVELGQNALVAEEEVVEAAPAKTAAAPVKTSTVKTSTARKSTTRKKSSSARRSSGSRSGSYSGSTVARQPRVVTKKNTNRDAVIGAAGGAVIGAVVGGKQNRVKGAVVGAALGTAAGAIIGSTIDKSTRVEY
jgi:outer membrane lipoprotein SlyB